MDERPLLIVDLEATCWENRTKAEKWNDPRFGVPRLGIRGTPTPEPGRWSEYGSVTAIYRFCVGRRAVNPAEYRTLEGLRCVESTGELSFP